MTAYRAGYLFERKVADDLAEDGYYVMQSRGSHGVADLVAVKPGQVLLVQCKGGAAGLKLGEWNALWSVAVKVGAVPLIASRPKRGVIAYTRITGVAEARRARPGEPWTADELRIAPVQRVDAALSAEYQHVEAP